MRSSLTARAHLSTALALGLVACTFVACALVACGRSSATQQAVPAASVSPPLAGGGSLPSAASSSSAVPAPFAAAASSAWRDALPSDPAARRCAIASHDFEIHRPAFEAAAKAGPLPALPFGRCLAGRRGAWALSVEPAADNAVIHGWAAVHVDEHEVVTRRVRVIDSTGSDEADLPSHGLSPRFGKVIVFDYDGDGDPELLVEAHSDGAGGGNPPDYGEGIVLTARGGTIAPYAPAAAFTIFGFPDADGDGRPDIDTSSPYATGRGAFFEFAPKLVAHSLPDGRFSTTDAVASAAARRVCPTKPGADLRLREGADKERKIVCARLWGVSAEAVRSAMDPDDNRDYFGAFIDATPPLSLSVSSGASR